MNFYSELKFIVEDFQNGNIQRRDWRAKMDSSSSQVYFQNTHGNDKKKIQYSGSGEFVDGVQVLIKSSGFHMNKLTSGPTNAVEEIYLTDPNQFVILETDDCNICENGRYKLDTTLGRTGWFEFQGKIIPL